jgi:hypothetical protein
MLSLPTQQLSEIQELNEVVHEMSQCISEVEFPFPLDKILKKPPYITITNLSKLGGSFGHGTAFFKRPVL